MAWTSAPQATLPEPRLQRNNTTLTRQGRKHGQKVTGVCQRGRRQGCNTTRTCSSRAGSRKLLGLHGPWEAGVSLPLATITATINCWEAMESDPLTFLEAPSLKSDNQKGRIPFKTLGSPFLSSGVALLSLRGSHLQVLPVSVITQCRSLT